MFLILSYLNLIDIIGGLVIYVIPIVVDECRVHPCENGGTCTLDEDFQKQCDCTPTFLPPNCEDGMQLGYFYIENIKFICINMILQLQCILSLFRGNM